MRGQILPDAVAKDLGAEILLQHPEDGPTLLVRQHVEHGLGVLGSHYLELDGAARPKTVRQKGGGPRHAEVVPAPPGGLPRVDRQHLHERGEGLVQPESVPPRHRHQIPEPHVGDLVGHHVGHPGELGMGGAPLVHQKRGLAKRDGAQILHGAEGEVGNGDQVQLVPRIGHGEVLPEEAQGERRHLECERAEMPLPRNGPDPDRDPVRLDGVGRLQRPDHERQEIRGHRDGRREGHRLFAALRHAPDTGHRRVGDRRQRLVHDQRHLKDRLERGLVPAGKRAAGVGRLELGDRQHRLRVHRLP